MTKNVLILLEISDFSISCPDLMIAIFLRKNLDSVASGLFFPNTSGKKVNVPLKNYHIGDFWPNPTPKNSLIADFWSNSTQKKSLITNFWPNLEFRARFHWHFFTLSGTRFPLWQTVTPTDTPLTPLDKIGPDATESQFFSQKITHHNVQISNWVINVRFFFGCRLIIQNDLKPRN